MTPGKRGGLTVEHEAGIHGGAWRRAAEATSPWGMVVHARNKGLPAFELVGGEAGLGTGGAARRRWAEAVRVDALDVRSAGTGKKTGEVRVPVLGATASRGIVRPRRVRRTRRFVAAAL
jgi:hypothetical protein